ncbi:Regulator of rDNA transcription protein 15 [Capsicum chinense]|nr:Regulator of rDNA transcription protein 15 [Capsicum chinense]
MGLSPSLAPPSRGHGASPPLRTLLKSIIRTMEPPDSKAGLFPIRSPLLRESLPKGSLGHAFMVHIHTGNHNQMSFYHSVPHDISVLVELILGHLHYLLTDVPPQPNSPPDNRRPPKEQIPVHPPTSMRLPALAKGASRVVHQQPMGSGLGPLCPTLSANPSPEVTDPFCLLSLPTLFHRPEVCIQFGTVTRFLVHPASPILLTRNGPFGALDFEVKLNKAAAGPTPKSEGRFACQYRCGPPPEFSVASPRLGIVHHLSGPNMYAHT